MTMLSSLFGYMDDRGEYPYRCYPDFQNLLVYPLLDTLREQISTTTVAQRFIRKRYKNVGRPLDSLKQKISNNSRANKILGRGTR